MRIGFFTSDFARKGPFEASKVSWGGVGEATYQLAMELNERGHVIEISTIGPCNRQTTYEGITLHEYSSELSISGTSLSIQFLYDYRGDSLDIIHIHRGSPSGAIAGYVHAKRSNTPYIFTVHGDLHFRDNSYLRNALLRGFSMISTSMLSNAEYVTTVSDTFRKNSVYLRGFSDKTVIVPNGIELPDGDQIVEKFDLPLENRYPIILYLGALVPRKNPGAIVEAAPDIVNEYPNALFIIAGSGSQIEELTRTAEKEGLSNNIIFTGFIPEEQKQSLYESADIFCLPSNNESFGLTAFEAAANGLPIILGDIPIFHELFDQSARYVSPGDTDEIYSAIVEILGNEGLRNRISRQAQKQAAKYSWEKVANEYIELYEDALTCQ